MKRNISNNPQLMTCPVCDFRHLSRLQTPTKPKRFRFWRKNARSSQNDAIESIKVHAVWIKWKFLFIEWTERWLLIESSSSKKALFTTGFMLSFGRREKPTTTAGASGKGRKQIQSMHRNDFCVCVSVGWRPECVSVFRRTPCILLVSFFHCAHCVRIAVVFNSSIHINTNARTIPTRLVRIACVTTTTTSEVAGGGTQDWLFDGRCRRAPTEMIFLRRRCFCKFVLFFHSGGVDVCARARCVRPPCSGHL